MIITYNEKHILRMIIGKEAGEQKRIAEDKNTKHEDMIRANSIYYKLYEILNKHDDWCDSIKFLNAFFKLIYCIH